MRGLVAEVFKAAYAQLQLLASSVAGDVCVCVCVYMRAFYMPVPGLARRDNKLLLQVRSRQIHKSRMVPSRDLTSDSSCYGSRATDLTSHLSS